MRLTVLEFAERYRMLDPNKGMKNGNKTHTGAVDTAPNSAPSSGAFYWHSRHWAAPNLHGWNNEWQPCR